MPFETHISPSGDYSIITLKDLSTQTHVEVYSFGALLNGFTVIHQGLPLNVVDGFSSIAEAVENITPFFKSAKLSPYVCRVRNGDYKFGDKEYQLTKYAMRGQAIHGLVYDASFTVADYGSDDSSAFVRLSYTYSKTGEGYPFPYQCTIEYRLEKDNSLTVSTTISNMGESLIPVTDGWHPYFTLGDTINEYLVEFQSKEMLEFDDDLIPTGKLIPYEEFGSLREFGTTWFDNCFTLNFAECQPMFVMRNPHKNIQFEIHPSASYPYLQFYTPDHRKSIAVENLSAAPDAFNNGMGLKTLSPGEEVLFSTKFMVRSL